MLLLYEVVENKMMRDKQTEIEEKLKKEVKTENKYHLVQNYNNELVRRSLKSQNNHHRLNVKEKRNNLDKISKKLEEKNRKKVTTLLAVTATANNNRNLAATLKKPTEAPQTSELQSLQNSGHRPPPSSGTNSRVNDRGSETSSSTWNQQKLNIKTSLIKKLQQKKSKAGSNAEQGGTDYLANISNQNTFHRVQKDKEHTRTISNKIQTGLIGGLAGGLTSQKTHNLNNLRGFNQGSSGSPRPDYPGRGKEKSRHSRSGSNNNSRVGGANSSSGGKGNSNSSNWEANSNREDYEEENYEGHHQARPNVQAHPQIANFKYPSRNINMMTSLTQNLINKRQKN